MADFKILTSETIDIFAKRHYDNPADVNSQEFEGKSIIDQHKIIYAILDEYIQSGEIHALTLKTAPKK